MIEKYSKENVAQIITFGSIMAKGVIRDVGRVMGLAYADVDRIAKLVPGDPGITLQQALEIEPELKAILSMALKKEISARFLREKKQEL